MDIVLVTVAAIGTVAAVIGIVIYNKYQSDEYKTKPFIQVLTQTLKEITVAVICTPIIVIGSILLMCWVIVLPLLYNIYPTNTFVRHQHETYIHREHEGDDTTAPPTPQSV